MSPSLSLFESADRFGRYRYVELELYRRLGRVAPSCERAELAVYVSAASGAHGYRARLAESMLPLATNLDPRPFTRSPGPVFDEALEHLAAPGDDDGLLDALVGVLYPQMAATYASHRAAAVGPSDGPARRVLARMVADLEAVRADAPPSRRPPATSGRARALAAALSTLSGPFGAPSPPPPAGASERPGGG